MSNDGTTLVFRVTFPLTEEEVQTFTAKVGTHAPLHAWVAHGTLHIRGLPQGAPYRIYTITGALVYRGVATGSNLTTASVPLQSGVHILRTENQAVKFLGF